MTKKQRYNAHQKMNKTYEEEKVKTFKRDKTTRKKNSSILLDERVQETAKDGVQVNEEVFLADNLDKTLGLHHVAGHTGKAIRVELLGGQEGRDGCDITEVWCTCRRQGAFLLR